MELSSYWYPLQVGDSAVATGTTETVTADYVSPSVVICPLGTARPVFIQVSNDGSSVSADNLLYVAYNPICYECSSTGFNTATCTTKV